MAVDTAEIVSSIADLRSVDGSKASHAFVTGYHAAGDGGGGTYYLDAADTSSADNGGTVIVATDGGRWKLLHQGVLSIKQFGAKVDATTDDQAAVQAAIDAVSHVHFPSGPCKINSTLALRSHLLLELAPDAVIDFSGAAVGDTLFDAHGSLGDYALLTATAAAGARTIRVGATDGFGVGDWLKIKAETLFDSTANSRRKVGEINRVLESYSGVEGDELTATTIPLVADLQATYKREGSAAVARLLLLENITIRGGALRGYPSRDNNQIAIEFNYTFNCRVENVTVEQFDGMGVHCRNSIGLSVTGCRFVNARSESTAYGVAFSDATADSIASNNHFDEVRHSLTTTNSRGDHGIPRRILFSNNTVRSSTRALESRDNPEGAGGDAIDTHLAAEDISIIGNTVLGSSGQGINVECPTAVVIGNTVNDARSNAISVHNEADQNGSIVVANNRVERCASAGIVVSQGGRGTKFAYTEIVVAGNTVEFAGVDPNVSGPKGGIVVKAVDDDVVNRAVSITGNSVRDTQDFGIQVRGIRCGAITGNSVSKVPGIGIDAVNIQSVSIASNSVQTERGSEAGIRLSVAGAGTTRDNAIVGNTIGLTAGTSDTFSVKLENQVTKTAVVANIQQGGTGGVSLGSGPGNVAAHNI